MHVLAIILMYSTVKKIQDQARENLMELMYKEGQKIEKLPWLGSTESGDFLPVFSYKKNNLGAP